jgi:putative ABC transport system permease protein
MWLFDRDLWSEVFSTLTKNMLRTVLTTLGVIFAIIILILLLGSATGMINGFDRIFAGKASNSLFVWGQETSMPYKGFERGRPVEYEMDDITMLTKRVEEVDVISPRIELGGFQQAVVVKREGSTSGSRVFGDFSTIDLVNKKKIVEGRFINLNDVENGKKVCVIGLETYELLFDKGISAIGKDISINNIYFTVIGVYEKSGDFDFDGENSVIIPFTTFQRSFNSGDRVGWMAILVNSKFPVAQAEKKIKDLLKVKYDIHPDDNRAIGSFDFSQIFTAISAFTMVLQGFAFFVGIFTMLAGVIAVSNILLITVKERTKEIGVRRALGATPKVIKRQIILESIVLTVIAGAVGFVIAVGLLYILNVQTASNTDVPFVNPTVSMTQILVSFTLMTLLSILIGLIPARRAVRIKPIEALRED